MKNNLIEEVCSTLYKLTWQLSRLGTDTYLINFMMRNSPAIESTIIEIWIDNGDTGRSFRISMWNDKPDFTNIVYKGEYDKCVDYLKTEIAKLSEGKDHD